MVQGNGAVIIGLTGSGDWGYQNAEIVFDATTGWWGGVDRNPGFHPGLFGLDPEGPGNGFPPPIKSSAGLWRE
jgi:hypothetical protein